jgi:hypothetical protein
LDKNNIKFIDYKKEKKYPKIGEDHYHFNSLTVHKNNLFILAHNKGKSFVMEFSDLSAKPRKTYYNFGIESHNILFIHNNMYTLSSREKNIIQYKKSPRSYHNKGYRSKPKNKILAHINTGWLRGLSETKKYFFVGVTKEGERKIRPFLHSHVYVYNKR